MLEPLKGEEKKGENMQKTVDRRIRGDLQQNKRKGNHKISPVSRAVLSVFKRSSGKVKTYRGEKRNGVCPKRGNST